MSDGAGKPTRLERLIRVVYCASYRDYVQRVTGKADTTYGTRRMPVWDGGTDRFGRKYERSAWSRIADFVQKHQIDPIRLIRWRFDRWTGQTPPPPSVMYGEKALAFYQEIQQTIDVRSAERLMNEQQTFLDRVQYLIITGIPVELAGELCLRDRTLPLSALFRYCTAVRTGKEEIAESYCDAALFDYAFGREIYDKTWQHFIPPALNRLAESYIESIYSSGESRRLA